MKITCQFFCILLVSLLVLFTDSQVDACTALQTPCVVFCYNTTARFSQDGYTASIGAPPNTRSCTCRMKTESSAVKLRISLDVMAVNTTFCQRGQSVQIRPSSGIGSIVSRCYPDTVTLFEVSSTNALHLEYTNPARFSSPFCVNYHVTEGSGEVIMDCDGDPLPITTMATTLATSLVQSSTKRPLVTSKTSSTLMPVTTSTTTILSSRTSSAPPTQLTSTTTLSYPTTLKTSLSGTLLPHSSTKPIRPTTTTLTPLLTTEASSIITRTPAPSESMATNGPTKASSRDSSSTRVLPTSPGTPADSSTILTTTFESKTSSAATAEKSTVTDGSPATTNSPSTSETTVTLPIVTRHTPDGQTTVLATSSTTGAVLSHDTKVGIIAGCLLGILLIAAILAFLISREDGEELSCQGILYKMRTDWWRGGIKMSGILAWRNRHRSRQLVIDEGPILAYDNPAVESGEVSKQPDVDQTEFPTSTESSESSQP